MSRTYFAHLTFAELKHEALIASQEMQRMNVNPAVYNHAKMWKSMAESEMARRRFTAKQYLARQN